MRCGWGCGACAARSTPRSNQRAVSALPPCAGAAQRSAAQRIAARCSPPSLLCTPPASPPRGLCALTETLVLTPSPWAGVARARVLRLGLPPRCSRQWRLLLFRWAVTLSCSACRNLLWRLVGQRAVKGPTVALAGSPLARLLTPSYCFCSRTPPCLPPQAMRSTTLRSWTPPPTWPRRCCTCTGTRWGRRAPGRRQQEQALAAPRAAPGPPASGSREQALAAAAARSSLSEPGGVVGCRSSRGPPFCWSC